MITSYHAKYYAHELVRRHETGSVDQLSRSLFDASVDLNPHQIDAALFALRNPLQEGVLLADEVGLGKTIEAALVLCQYWAERRRRLLIICPASLRKQWAQELHDKFALPATVVDSTTLRKASAGNDLQTLEHLLQRGIVIMSYPFARRLEMVLRAIAWDLVVIDEAHKLRNAHRPSNQTGQALKRALQGRKKILLTATPLQNSLMELYGLSTLLDEHLFGDEKSFRQQFINADGDTEELRARLATFAQRTLRKDVLEYIQYTERRAITQPFVPTDQEHALYERISAFLQREDSYALPIRQRHLTALIVRKLLASSPYAVSGTLTTIRERLEHQLEAQQHADNENTLLQNLFAQEDFESEWTDEARFDDEKADESSDEHSNNQPNANDDATPNHHTLEEEIQELNAFIHAAQNLQTDTKANALLTALQNGFAKMAELGAPRKAIIFTESRRTQEYLAQFLAEQGYQDKTVCFSGTNTSPEAQKVYQDWVEQYRDTERFTGSPQVDRRTALIDHFRQDDGTGADIMIATEAAAEGVNLQFCALVINYDLPWNPQRVEQRIGRCHRYGQRFDVVVINFLNTRNQADQRVLELLTEKFQLFSGVFGASDEILGGVEANIDFEKRVLSIYDTCRQPEDIENAFNELQQELEASITDRILDTQSQLLEHFDEDVHDRLKLRLVEAQSRLDRIGRWLWGSTRYALRKYASFDDNAYAFSLHESPIAAPKGRYQLIRGAAQPDLLAHAYRLNHPLGEWVLQPSLNAITPTASIVFDYDRYHARISMLEELRGTSGWLTLSHVEVTSFDTTEALIFSSVTDEGNVLDQEFCEKLLNLPAQSAPRALEDTGPEILRLNNERAIAAMIARVLESNQRLFNEERDKLERWADDKLLAAEMLLKNTKAQLQQRKRDSRRATTLQEQETIQKDIAELERLQRRQRREIFDVEDEIIARRDDLIDMLHERMQESTRTTPVFTLRWQLL